MDFDIYFCVDGILRAKFSDDKPMIPMKFLHDNGIYKGSDFRFWARWWEYDTYFESGLTVGKFLSCLEPWGDFWSDFTGKDIVSYIKESRHPIAVINEDENNIKPTWVSISYATDLSPISEYLDNENLEDMLSNINEWINKPKNTRLTGEWDIHSSYKVTSFIEGKEEQYSIECSPMNKLANLPIVLSDKHMLYFANWKLNQILGNGKDHFFQDNAFGLCSMSEGFIKFLIGSKKHNIQNIVKGFFFNLHANPTRRNDFIDSVLEKKNEINDIIQASFEQPNNSNIINLFNKDSAKVNYSSTIKTSKANNVFNPILMSIDRDRNYWEEMLERAYKKNNVVLKIGKTEKAQAPEKRLLNYIIRNDNDPANPKPSNYKLW